MGGGLVTLFCPHNIYPILAAACPPEVMVRPVNSCLEIRDFHLDAIGIGSGMGNAPLPYLTELLFHDPRPVIIDADALNALAAGPWLADGSAKFAGPRLLTPHPGELARLIKTWNPALAGQPRRAQAQAFTDAFPVTLLAKSARSLVIEKNLPAAWNSTGHPLMARGGMGDVLTGFLTTFAAQKMPLYHAAMLGSWLIGRGAELYHRTTGHTEPGTASEVMAFAAGHAMAELRA
jgi:NAD(P)H-hydrate epimerase